MMYEVGNSNASKMCLVVYPRNTVKDSGDEKMKLIKVEIRQNQTF